MPTILKKSKDFALIVATLDDDTAAAQHLLDDGADPNTPEHFGFQPLMRAKSAEMTTLLIAAGADVNATDHVRWTPLMHAAANSNLSVITVLLQHGARTDISTVGGSDVFLIAKRIGGRKTLKFLKNAIMETES